MAVTEIGHVYKLLGKAKWPYCFSLLHWAIKVFSASTGPNRWSIFGTSPIQKKNPKTGCHIDTLSL